MYKKFIIDTIDNSDIDWEKGKERDLKFMADLVFHQFNETIYIEYRYNKFRDDDNPVHLINDMREESLGKISIEDAKELIKALQFMTEGK